MQPADYSLINNNLHRKGRETAASAAKNDTLCMPKPKSTILNPTNERDDEKQNAQSRARIRTNYNSNPRPLPVLNHPSIKGKTCSHSSSVAKDFFVCSANLEPKWS
jgi:hypothetical protein